uniref:Serpentine receptor class gamma n=1 Tax=Panagrellus redivivus TaxID=6233 RepID=A0A7E4UL79_PANRE
MISSVYHLHAVVLRPQEERCHWLSFGQKDCYLIKNITNMLMFLIYSGTAAFSLERIINTLIYPPQAIKNAIAGIIVAIQFATPLMVIFRSPVKNNDIHAHCVAHYSNLVQYRQFFFVIIGIVIFSLAVYTVLQLQTSTVLAQQKRVSLRIHASIAETQITFPIVLVSITLFLTNVLLDRHIFLALQGYFPWMQFIADSRSITVLAFWNELQSLTLPIFSMIIFGLMVRHAWRVDADFMYDKALSDCAHSLKAYYETAVVPAPRSASTTSSPDLRALRDPPGSPKVERGQAQGAQKANALVAL